MRNHGPQLFFFLLILAAAITLACGSSSHIPQSVAVAPPTADAKDFPGGVQFTATASYNSMPSPVKNISATWTACGMTAGSLEPATLVTVSSSGVAQCLSGASGNYTVYAFVRNPAFHDACPGSLLCGNSCGGVVGSAQLTCP